MPQIDLSAPGREPRGAIDVCLAAGGRDVRVITAHLGLQLAKLLNALDADPAEPDGRPCILPCILLGDLNEWHRRGGSLQPLETNLGPMPVSSTFPSSCPALPLDRIFASGARAGAKPSVAAQVHRSRGVRIASDHLPLRAVITWDVAAACSTPAEGEAARRSQAA